MNTVLVVDDSVMDRRRAGGLIEKDEDWTVAYAGDGNEALGQIESVQPDVVVTDLTMPGMNGLELVSEVRLRHPHLPVVIMTSMGSEDVAVKALKEGAASYVPKRRLAGDLLNTVRSVVTASREVRNQSELMEHVTRNVHAYSLPPDLSLVLSLGSHLQQLLAEMWGCRKKDLINVGIALEEALVNAFYHGCLEVETQLRDTDYAAFADLTQQRIAESPYKDRKIHVEATLSRPKATFVIRDDGRGFDPSQLPDPTDPANMDHVCGRGLVLISTFMDAVTHNARGNEITMVKHRPRKLQGT